jgi:hypothetical protein
MCALIPELVAVLALSALNDSTFNRVRTRICDVIWLWLLDLREILWGGLLYNVHSKSGKFGLAHYIAALLGLAFGEGGRRVFLQHRPVIHRKALWITS